MFIQCHYSYSACGLGSDGTDRLVQLVQEMQHGKSSVSGDGTLYGAKITGGGSGGTICVMGRNCLRSSEQILQVINKDTVSYQKYISSCSGFICLFSWFCRFSKDTEMQLVTCRFCLKDHHQVQESLVIWESAVV